MNLNDWALVELGTPSRDMAPTHPDAEAKHWPKPAYECETCGVHGHSEAVCLRRGGDVKKEEAATQVRCSAWVEGRTACGELASAILQYDSNGFTDEGLKPWSDRQRYDHPLCETHNDPDFHLRDLDSPNWRVVPIPSGSTGADQ